MNREDRAKFLALITEKQPALLEGVDRENITDDAIMALLAQAMTPPPALTVEAIPGGVADNVPAIRQATGPQLSQRQLQALCDRHELTYRTSERVEDVQGGQPRRVWQPRLRPLGADDILSHRVDGPLVTIVTADGQKRTLARA
jgi:hypothetical protein